MMKLIFGQEVHAALNAERARVCTPSTKYPGCFESESLCAWQSDVHRRGIEGARLVESVYGWSVRADSGLDNFALLAGSSSGQLDGTREDAERWARKWQADRPEHRYVWEYTA